MKSALFAGALAVALAASAATAAYAGEVRVTLSHVQHRPGRILAALQTEQQFLKGPGDYNASVVPPATEGDVTLDFTNVAPGDYALAVMHDEDGDHQMKKAANGMPLEGWAFSNGGELRGPPTFDVTKFTVTATGVVNIHADMYYPYVPPAGQ